MNKHEKLVSTEIDHMSTKVQLYFVSKESTLRLQVIGILKCTLALSIYKMLSSLSIG